MYSPLTRIIPSLPLWIRGVLAAHLVKCHSLCHQSYVSARPVCKVGALPANPRAARRRFFRVGAGILWPDRAAMSEGSPRAIRRRCLAARIAPVRRSFHRASCFTTQELVKLVSPDQGEPSSPVPRQLSIPLPPRNGGDADWRDNHARSGAAREKQRFGFELIGAGVSRHAASGAKQKTRSSVRSFRKAHLTDGRVVPVAVWRLNRTVRTRRRVQRDY